VTDDITFGIGYVRGNVAYDRLCIGGTSMCTEDDFKFLLGHTTNDLDDSQAGLIGLAPPTTYYNHDNEFFVSHLYENGAVDHNIFSLYVDLNNTSQMTIGGYDTDEYARGRDITWHDLPKRAYHWEMTMSKVEMKMNGITSRMGEGEDIILDCGTSVNLMPYRHWMSFKSRL